MLKNITLIAGSFLAFAVIHSLTAGHALPGRLSRLVGARLVEGWYRLAYNLFSVLTFASVVAFNALLPDQSIYALGGMPGAILRLIQVISLAALLWALWSIDFPRFAGLRQACAFLSGSPLPLPEEALQRRGLYAWMRHPLYVFSLLVLWAAPTMTVNAVIFNVCAIIYFVVGASIEERRMLSIYGEGYRAYRSQVPAVFAPPRYRDP